MKATFVLLTIACLLQFSAHCATVQIEWLNEAGTELLTLGGDPLTNGDNATSCDGAILELGHYTLADVTNPFAGQWVPLYQSTIGCKAPGSDLPGRFEAAETFGLQPGVTPASADVPIVIRFYDSQSLDSAAYFNGVSNSTGSWNWVNPDDPAPIVTLSLSDPGLLWQDGPASAFRTTIPIPEPSPLLLATSALVLLTTRRRRLASRSQTASPL